ncbi:metal-dependent hydrolase [Candidatus Woesearchaeota archaeon]|nr:metal-dependent hydrolase [Candidatus Woesearchaeota archaeon]
MIFLTHLLGGIFSVVYFGGFLGIDAGIISMVIAALFAILPDIDMVKSKAGKHLQPFSVIASLLFRHRGFLHSFIFAAVVYFSVQYLFSAAIAAAAAIGYSSHLLLDSLTKEGIMPLSPLSKARIKGFVKTGGRLEKVLAAVMVLLLLAKII